MSIISGAAVGLGSAVITLYIMGKQAQRKNAAIAQILKSAREPLSIIELASYLNMKPSQKNLRKIMHGLQPSIRRGEIAELADPSAAAAERLEHRRFYWNGNHGA